VHFPRTERFGPQGYDPLQLTQPDNPQIVRIHHDARTQLRLAEGSLLLGRDLLEGIEDPALHAVILLLIKAVRDGSVCLSTAALSAYRPFLESIELTEADVARAATADSALIGDSLDTLRPVIRTARQGASLLFFEKQYVHYKAAAARTEALIRPATLPAFEWHSGVREALQQERLNQEQKTAVLQAVLQNFSLISGGPGTGKTTVVAAIVKALIALDVPAEAIRLVAPTGRAAQRLTDAVGTSEGAFAGLAQGLTIHRLLSYDPRACSFRYNRRNPLQLKAIIVDEVSMVDLAMMSRLLAAIADDCRLVMLGDKDQLPSVEAGAILSDLLPADATPGYSSAFRETAGKLWPDLAPLRPQCGPTTDCFTLLKQSYRSQANITCVVEALQTGSQTMALDVPELLASTPVEHWPWSEGGVYRMGLDVSARSTLEAQLQGWLSRFFLQPTEAGAGTYADLVTDALEVDVVEDPAAAAEFAEKFSAYGSTARILTTSRKGVYGCDAINAFLAKQFVSRAGLRDQGGIFSGAPITITTNDREIGLFNGDFGVVLLDASKRWRALFARPAGPLIVPLERLPRFELGFAITVHKSQGGEFDSVFFVLAPATSRLLTHQILYTGITRARKFALIVGTVTALQTGLGYRIIRQSGGSLWPTQEVEEADDSEYADLPLFAGL